MKKTEQETCATKPAPMIVVTTISNTVNEPPVPLPSPSTPKPKKKHRSVSDQSGSSSNSEQHNILMAYNEYGELVDVEKMMRPRKSEELGVTETLRLINKAHRIEFTVQMRAVVTAALELCRLARKGRLAIWEFMPKATHDMSPEHLHKVPVYNGPPRMLEIGCANGDWCFEMKRDHPDWIIEGVDEADHWSESKPEMKLRDFMESDDVKETTDYFSRVHLTQENPEFLTRNINQLLLQPDPIPTNLYSMVRGRDIFDRVESYKAFLEDVRQMLQPEGVVEFLEVDPRPRTYVVKHRRSYNCHHTSHTSGPETDWSDQIADRFKDPYGEQLTNMIPRWTERVEERLKATLRPKDGVPAPQLKSWLEGAGYWDVKELVLPMPVGGTSPGGQLLLQTMVRQINAENFVPLLAAQLPGININDLSTGNFYINLHVVTARKPRHPRPGDLLMDGTRQEMNDSKYNAMARLNEAKSHLWRRFDLDGRMTSMLQSLTMLDGGPEQVSQASSASDFSQSAQSSE